MNNRLVRTILLLAILLFPQWSMAGSTSTEPLVLVQTSKEKASYALHIECSLNGVFSDEKRIFYFRPQDDDSSGFMESSHSNADGLGVGYGLSMSVLPRASQIEVNIGTYWTSEISRGQIDAKLQTSPLKNAKGTEAGLEYSFRWVKVKQSTRELLK